MHSRGLVGWSGYYLERISTLHRVQGTLSEYMHAHWMTVHMYIQHLEAHVFLHSTKNNRGGSIFSHMITNLPCAYLYTQSTTKQASRQTVVFPGFALTLRPEEEELLSEAGDCLAILRDVGLAVSPPAQPTHLEVVQIINTTTLPFIWLSPLQCTLYPVPLQLMLVLAFVLYNNMCVCTKLWCSIHSCVS